MVKPWDTATIGDFLEFKNGLNKGKEFFGHGTPIVNYTDVYKKRGLKRADIRGRVCLTPDEIHRFDVRKNDVFFTRTSETPDEVGMPSVLLEDVENGVFSGFVLRGRPKNDMFVPEYCKYCFSTEAVRNAIITGCTYTTRALTNGKQLSAIEIPVPSKPEQEAIAAALSDIDALIANLEKLIAKKKAIKQGAMQELLTGKRRLPGFDGEWKTKRLKDVLTIYNGYAFKSSTYDNNTGIYKVITIANVQKGYLSTLSCNMILELPSDIQQHQLLNLGDLLISMTGNVGRVCFVTEERTVLNQRVGKLCTFDAHHDGFIFNALNTPWFLRAMMTSAKGGAQPNLSVKDIYEYELRCPPTIEEERAISTVLDDMQTEITMLEKKLAKLCKTRSGMMSELLTGRIRLIDKEDA